MASACDAKQCIPIKPQLALHILRIICAQLSGLFSKLGGEQIVNQTEELSVINYQLQCRQYLRTIYSLI